MSPANPLASIPPPEEIRRRLRALRGEILCLRDLLKAAERARAKAPPGGSRDARPAVQPEDPND